MTFCERLGKILRDRNCEIENESDYLSSAVLVPLVRREGRLGVLFEVRSTALTWQPGDICLPGGRIELDDAEGNTVRRRLAWVSARTGQTLLVDGAHDSYLPEF